MKLRNIKQVTFAQEFQMGPMRVKQPLPAKELDQLSPFILLHHAGPDHHKAGEPRTRLNAHPHRGFEPVTFLFQGKIHHKDSLGNEGFLNAGDVQWMTSGKGIIHSEGPSSEFAKEGGNIELIQLWVNLPREHKMTDPKYQDIKKDQMPVINENENNIQLQLVAGEYKNVRGPASTFTPILAMMVHFKKGAKTVFEIPATFNAMIYVLDGIIDSNRKQVEKLNMAVFDNAGDGIDFNALSDGKLLFLAGEPINEPLVSYGPFVMNYPAEIKEAMLDYETGKMGVLND